jgi:hypothetical protein
MAVADKNLREAAYLRHYLGLPWTEVARRCCIHRTTLWRHSKTAKWEQIVAELTAHMQHEALPTGLGCLIRMAAMNDVQAAKALVALSMPAKLEVQHVGRYAQMTDEELDAEIACLEAELGHRVQPHEKPKRKRGKTKPAAASSRRAWGGPAAPPLPG